MSQKRARRQRQERQAAGLPKFKPPLHNFQDRDDNRADRRLRTKHRKRYDAELRDTDPKAGRELMRKWSVVFLYLRSPRTFRPYLKMHLNDTSQETRQQAFELALDKEEAKRKAAAAEDDAA